jgi:glutathione S-transferase
MLTLYYAPGACSMAAHIVLEESGEKYEEKKIDLAGGEQRTAGYLKINPLGRVPVLLLDSGEPLADNTAILPYLGKRFNLWPIDTIAEAKALSLIGFFAASVHFSRLFKANRQHASGPRLAFRPLLRARSLRLRFLHLGRAPRSSDERAQELHRIQRPDAQTASRCACA